MSKKIIASICALLLAGCAAGTTAAPETAQTTAETAPEPVNEVENTAPAEEPEEKGDGILSVKTMGELFAQDISEIQRGNTEDSMFVIFSEGKTLYRAYADLPKDIFDQLVAIDINAEDFETQYKEIAGVLEIRQIDNLTEMIPAQEELNQWVGRTAGEMHEAGWDVGDSYSYDFTQVDMTYGPFTYVVTLEKPKAEINPYDFDFWAAVGQSTVLGVTYDGVGNGAEIPVGTPARLTVWSDYSNDWFNYDTGGLNGSEY